MCGRIMDRKRRKEGDGEKFPKTTLSECPAVVAWLLVGG